MTLAQKYAKSLNDHWCLRLNTRRPVEDSHEGVITHVKRGFIALNVVAAFEFDGVIILPKRSIKGFRDGSIEKCTNQILRDCGAMKKHRRTRWLDRCETLGDVAEQLWKRDIWPLVETLYNQNTESDCFLGPIVRLAENGFLLHSYGPAGNWQKECEITFGEIFAIHFDAQYTNHFNTFMRKQDRDLIADSATSS